MTNEELIAYYVNLLIIQYRGLPRAEGTIGALTRSEIIFEVMRAVESGYNIDELQGPTAEGTQLDVIGKYVGADRVVTGVDFTRTYFGFVDYGEATPYTDVAGLLDYSGIEPPDAQMLDYDSDQQSIFTLNDQELLSIISLKIAQNVANHSPGSIDLSINQFFGGNAIFTDEKNMTVSYVFDESIQRLVQIAQSQNAIPKPAAVGLVVSFTPDIENIFGFLDYDAETVPDYMQGMIDYSDTPFGGWLTY